MGEVRIIHSNFVKKLKDTQFYELRVKAGNEYRVILFAIDHMNFAQCTKAICLTGFMKKSTKDYNKALKKAGSILEEMVKNDML